MRSLGRIASKIGWTLFLDGPLVQLVDLLRPVDATLVALRRGMNSLTPYAVEYRYPGISATKRQAQAALRHAEKVRAAIRQRLGLPI